MIALGPFEINEPVGSGAMGQVWDGWHVRTRTPVAVKFVVADGEQAELAAASVRREAQAIAGLQHPHVVYVYDQGVVDERLADQLPGVPAGSPWIVMELLSGGTLRERHAETSWERIQEDLGRILEALAHCHARGVLHRDLKPTNVLFGTARDPRPGLKLVDFGIAWSDSHGDDIQFGTPEFCAPEQLGNETHAQGPWSDLYAVGAIGWQLATGEVPMPGLVGAPLFMAKASGQFRAFEPRVDVPDALADWLRRAMAGPPGDRFQSAVDALHALRQVGGRVRRARHPVVLGTDAAATRAVVGGEGLSARVKGAPEPAPLVRELISVPIPPPALLDAGLGLWRHRPAQFTARMPQRVRLWQRLEHAVRDRKVRLASLRGRPGSGRTRTAKWLLEAARMNGGVHALYIRAGGHGAGLSDLLSNALGGGPSDADGLENARWLLEHHGITFRVVVDAVEQWFARPDDPERQARAAIAVVRSLARTRPLVLVLDDADHDPSLVAFAERLAEGPDAGMLVLATCSEPLSGSFDEVPTLDPLRKREMSQVLASVLPLSIGTLSNLVAASGGLPGHGLQMVRAAFDEGRCEHGPAGLEVDFEPEAPVALPRLPLPLSKILERAALLGVYPDQRDLTQSFGNQRRASTALRHVEQRGLLTVQGEVVRFAPGVRKAVLATRNPSWRRHHLALARTLPPESPEGAMHQVRGGEVQAGFEKLQSALGALDLGSDLYRMLDYCEQGLELWDACGSAPADGPWGFLVLKRTEVLSGLRSDDLEAVLASDLERARSHGAWNAVAGLLVERAAFGRRGASRDLHFALEVAETDALRARALHGLSRQAEREKNVPLARHWLLLAAGAVANADREAAGHARIARARLASMDCDYERAVAEVEGAIRTRAVPGELDLMVAGIQLAMGDVAGARSNLLRGVHWMTLRRDRRWLPTALVRLGLVELLEGSPDACEARLAEADRIRAENRSRFGTDPSLGAPVRLVLCLERGEWFRAMEALGHCPELAWHRPTRVAVMARVAEMLEVRTDVPEPVREAIGRAVENFETLRCTWLTR